jgi:hypothetical protein
MISRDDLKHGQKVRVTFEGYVHKDAGRAFVSTVRGDAWTLTDPVTSLPAAAFSSSYEVLDGPRPEWWPPEDGDVVLLESPSGTRIRQRSGGEWFRPGDADPSCYRDEDMVDCAKALLVRDGTVYTGDWPQQQAA